VYSTQPAREHAILVLSRPGFMLALPEDVFALIELLEDDVEASLTSD